MSGNMSKSNDIKTQGIVLRRTNYGEADRILQLLTPEGKKSVKIVADYNKDCEADFTYNNMLEFLGNDGNTEQLI